MKPIASGQRAVDYFAKTDGGYYHGDAGLRCEWGGKGAEKLGLTGPPEQLQFERLVYGLNPHTGDQLTAKLVAGRIPAWDLTASVPKGVTTALERGDDRVREAVWRSFRMAMESLQEYATTRVRVDGQQDDRRTGNLVWYAVEHAETRPVEDVSLPEDHKWRVMPDWDRHIHGVIPNLTYDAVEDRWKAVKFRPIMDLRRFFDRSFDSLLAAELTGLGYEVETKWKREKDGGAKYFTWDIKAAPGFEQGWQSVNAKNSRRTSEVDATEAEIVEAIKAEHGESAPDRLTAVARDQLGATSRRTKRDDLTLAECREYWDSRITDDEDWAIHETIQRALRGLNPEPEQTVEQAVSFSMRHHFERESSLPVEELMATALERCLGAATPAKVERELTRQGVIVVERNGERLATTGELIAEEQGLAAFAANGRGSVAPIGLSPELNRGRLNAGQWEAVTGLLESENRVNLIEGPAGAGKSSLLKKFDEGARLAGQSVTYLATTATAVKVLNKDGFESNTLARFLLDERMQEQAKGSRVVIDESSMLSHADAVRLVDVAKAKKLKLILVGDPMQHGSIGRGAFMRLLKDYGHIKPFRLLQIMRQEDADYRAAAQLLYKGKSAEGFDALDAKGWVHEIADDADRTRQMAAEYLSASAEHKRLDPHERALVVSPTHAEAAQITAEIRSQLRSVSKLGKIEHKFTRLVPVVTTEAERTDPNSYRPGDVIQFHQNAKGFTKGKRLIVTDPVAVPVSEAARFSLYRPEAIGLAEHDVIRFTATVKSLDGEHTLRNGDTHSVAGFDNAGNIRLENGWVVAKSAGHFRHGFVETSIGSQGRTVQRVILGMAAMSLGATNQEQMYVSATRAKQSVSIYTDDKQAVRDEIQRSSQKRLALDLLPPKSEPAIDTEVERRRKHLAQRRRRVFADRLRAAWEKPLARWRQPAAVKSAAMSRTATHAERIRAEHHERSTGYER